MVPPRSMPPRGPRTSAGLSLELPALGRRLGGAFFLIVVLVPWVVGWAVISFILWSWCHGQSVGQYFLSLSGLGAIGPQRRLSATPSVRTYTTVDDVSHTTDNAASRFPPTVNADSKSAQSAVLRTYVRSRSRDFPSPSSSSSQLSPSSAALSLWEIVKVNVVIMLISASVRVVSLMLIQKSHFRSSTFRSSSWRFSAKANAPFTSAQMNGY